MTNEGLETSMCYSSVYLRNPENAQRLERSKVHAHGRRGHNICSRYIYHSSNNGFSVDRVSECSHGLSPVSPAEYGHPGHQYDTGEHHPSGEDHEGSVTRILAESSCNLNASI